MTNKETPGGGWMEKAEESRALEASDSDLKTEIASLEVQCAILEKRCEKLEAWRSLWKDCAASFRNQFIHLAEVGIRQHARERMELKLENYRLKKQSGLSVTEVLKDPK